MPILLLALLLPVMAWGAPAPMIILPKYRLSPDQVAVIVNDDDPLSLEIAYYYRDARDIPDANLIHVHFASGSDTMTPAEFAKVKAYVDAHTPAGIQGYALAWARPYRVGCMSITTAFAAGFSPAWCNRNQHTKCGTTRQSPYFASTSRAPYTDFHLRPTMMLAARNFSEAKILIDRGVMSDDSDPRGTAYLVSTPDRNRNVRAVYYPAIQQDFEPLLNVDIVKSDGIRNRRDVLFYFTGIAEVPYLDSLHFVPGAIADHLTSAGGVLFGTHQMSALRWLEAGATGSYGTVVEPCNYLQKFPNPAIVMQNYLEGSTLLEAYWKSVAWPGQGVFIGDPLASPFGGYTATTGKQTVKLVTHALAPGRYRLQTAPSMVGPYRNRRVQLVVHVGQTHFELPRLGAPVYRLVPANAPTPRPWPAGQSD